MEEEILVWIQLELNKFGFVFVLSIYQNIYKYYKHQNFGPLKWTELKYYNASRVWFDLEIEKNDLN